MGFFKRIFGICETRPPLDAGCWTYGNGKVEVDLGRAPELGRREGAIRLEGGGLPERILVFQGNDGEFHALVNKCMHMGRRIDPLAGSSNVRCCSVSKSTYDYTGKVISGPAKGPLTSLPVKSENGRLVIGLRL